MVIGDRLREFREQKQLSQGDIENRTGLLRCYISRVENGHTVPSIETLEKFARTLEIPIYQLFYDGDSSAAPVLKNVPRRKTADEIVWGMSGKDARHLANFCHCFSRTNERDRNLLLFLAQKMVTT